MKFTKYSLLAVHVLISLSCNKLNDRNNSLDILSVKIVPSDTVDFVKDELNILSEIKSHEKDSLTDGCGPIKFQPEVVVDSDDIIHMVLLDRVNFTLNQYSIDTSGNQSLKKYPIEEIADVDINISDIYGFEYPNPDTVLLATEEHGLGIVDLSSEKLHFPSRPKLYGNNKYYFVPMRKNSKQNGPEMTISFGGRLDDDIKMSHELDFEFLIDVNLEGGNAEIKPFKVSSRISKSNMDFYFPDNSISKINGNQYIRIAYDTVLFNLDNVNDSILLKGGEKEFARNLNATLHKKDPNNDDFEVIDLYRTTKWSPVFYFDNYKAYLTVGGLLVKDEATEKLGYFLFVDFYDAEFNFIKREVLSKNDLRPEVYSNGKKLFVQRDFSKDKQKKNYLTENKVLNSFVIYDLKLN